MRREIYGQGGYDPAKPNGNMLERWDLIAGYRRWTPTGDVAEDRPLTDSERAALADAPPAPDLPAIADQVTQLTDAVNLLILNSLGV